MMIMIMMLVVVEVEVECSVQYCRLDMFPPLVSEVAAAGVVVDHAEY